MILPKVLLISSLFFFNHSVNENPELLKEYASSSSQQVTQISLKLFADRSFQYTDQTRAEKQVVKGSWTQEKNKLSLQSETAEASFPDSWKIDEDFPCIKGRKGLTFYRICAE